MIIFKKYKLLYFKLFLVICTLIPIYIVLIIADIYLSKMVLIPQGSYKAKLIEEKRKSKDKLLQAEAKKSGYISLLHPNLIDDAVIIKNKHLKNNISLIGGIPLAKTYYCNEGYGLVKYTSDRFGLRNEDHKWEKDISTLFIGDSFIFGACVPNENYLSVFYELKTKKNTINLGMPGNNPSHYLAYSKIFVPKFRPKEVFMFFTTNDMGNYYSTLEEIYITKNKPFFGSKNELNDFNKTKEYGLEALQILYKNLKIKNDKKKNLNHYKLKALSKIFFTTVYKTKNKKEHQNYSLSTKKAIQNSFEICEKYNCKLNIVYLPHSNYWRKWNNKDTDKYVDFLREVTSQLKIKFYDVRKIINFNDKKYFAPEGHHYSIESYKNIIQYILQN